MTWGRRWRRRRGSGGIRIRWPCLTGALLGAALGEPAIPPEWLQTLPQRAEIAALADRLAAQSVDQPVCG